MIIKVDSKTANTIIFSRKPLGQFYVIEDGVYCAIANDDGNAWVEEFKTLHSAKRYLGGLPATDTSGYRHNR